MSDSSVAPRFDVKSRFWMKVDKAGQVPPHRPDLGPCWMWTASTNGKQGYGIFRGGTERDRYGSRKWVLAHRFAYECEVGPIPEGLEIDHLCRTRRCVRPSHFEVTNHRINTLRGESPPARQARRNACVNGHPFDTFSTPGKRRCSICDRAKEQRRHRRRYRSVA